MNDDSHIQDLLPAYALSCLDDSERRLVADHLAGCSLCRAELRAFEAIANDLALVVPDVAPSPDLRRRLLARVAPSPQRTISHPQPRSPRWSLGQRLLPLWGAVSLVMILALAAVNLLLWQRLNQLETAVTAGSMYAAPLMNTAAAPGASGMVIISPDGRNGAVVVDGLPVLDPAYEYQLWLVRDGERVSGAIFSVDEDGYAGRRIMAPDSLFTYTTVGITIEPAGGSPGPTGDRVLDGSLSLEFNRIPSGNSGD